jgi:hypothetical protein
MISASGYQVFEHAGLAILAGLVVLVLIARVLMR